jgi:hypothetical protein
MKAGFQADGEATLAKAIAIVRDRESEKELAIGLCNIGEHQATMHMDDRAQALFHEAYDAAQKIGNAATRDEVFGTIASAQGEAGFFDDAFNVVHAMKDPKRKVKTLCDIGATCCHKKNLERISQIIAEATPWIAKIERNASEKEADASDLEQSPVVSFVVMEIRAKRHPEALATARIVKDPFRRGDLLTAIASAWQKETKEQ